MLGRLFNKKIILLFLVIIIIILAISFFVLNSRLNPLTNTTNYNAELNSLIVSLDKNYSSKEKESPEYEKAINLFRNTSSLSDQKAKYRDFKAGTSDLQMLYSITGQSYMYKILNEDLAVFAKKHFPESYEEEMFIYPCQDPECADSRQPPEIISIINELKSSDFPEIYKDLYERNLLNTGYEPSDDKHLKAFQYYSTAKSIALSSDLSPSGAHTTISNKLFEFIKNNYPQDYEQFKRSEEARPKISPTPEPDPGPSYE